MFSSIENLTTIVSAAPLSFFSKNETTDLNLYFHLVLKVDGEIPGGELELSLKKYITGFVRAIGGNIKAVSFVQDRVHLLVGLSQFYAPGNFVRELKLISATYAQRKLGLKNFVWQERYEAFTVSLSQIERVCSYIRRQKSLDEQESYASSWQRIASRELY
ncbi:MAG: transposase [Actinomycetota bacterium]